MRHVIFATLFILALETAVVTFRAGRNEGPELIDVAAERAIPSSLDREGLKREMDRYLYVSAEEGGIPTAAVALWLDGEVIYQGTYHSTLRRQYPIASFTKTFVAMAVLILHERKALDIDKPVSTYLPVAIENPLIPGPPVTVRHLLTHTAGLASGGGNPAPGMDPPLYVPEQTCPAGVRFTYSNGGFNILGRLVQEVSGIPAGIFIRINILEPLGMTDTLAPETMPGASGMVSTVEDLIKYGSMLAGRGSWAGITIISESTFAEIFRPTLELPPAKNDEYRGIGWRVWAMSGVPVSLNHASLWDGSGGWMQVFPGPRIVYVFMSDPPSYGGEPFYHFYRGMKYRLLQMAALSEGRGGIPVDFAPDPPSVSDYMAMAGMYRNPLTGEVLEIRYHGGGLLAMGRGEARPLVAFSRSSFAYIFPGQTERGVSYDFVWRNGRFIALALSTGMYYRVE